MAKNWFVVHTYSGFEKFVAESIKQKAIELHLEDQVGQIIIPTEDVIEVQTRGCGVAVGRGLSACCLVAASLTRPLVGQEAVLPSVGSRVRVYSPLLTPGPLVGTLRAIDQRNLSVERAGEGQARAMALADVSRLETSVRPSQKKKGALLGLGAGFVVGFAGTAILGGLYGDEGDSDSLLVWGSIWGAAVAPVGAAIGAAVSPGEQWAETSIRQVPSGQGHAGPSAPGRIAIRPLVGRRCGIMLVASF